MSDKPAETSIPMAADIRVRCCEHGIIYIGFFDDNGDIFAGAAMDLTTAANFMDEMCAEAERALDIQQAERAEASGSVH